MKPRFTLKTIYGVITDMKVLIADDAVQSANKRNELSELLQLLSTTLRDMNEMRQFRRLTTSNIFEALDLLEGSFEYAPFTMDAGSPPNDDVRSQTVDIESAFVFRIETHPINAGRTERVVHTQYRFVANLGFLVTELGPDDTWLSLMKRIGSGCDTIACSNDQESDACHKSCDLWLEIRTRSCWLDLSHDWENPK